MAIAAGAFPVVVAFSLRENSFDFGYNKMKNTMNLRRMRI